MHTSSTVTIECYQRLSLSDYSCSDTVRTARYMLLLLLHTLYTGAERTKYHYSADN
jgi:hypothetical protein